MCSWPGLWSSSWDRITWIRKTSSGPTYGQYFMTNRIMLTPSMESFKITVFCIFKGYFKYFSFRFFFFFCMKSNGESPRTDVKPSFTKDMQSEWWVYELRWDMRALGMVCPTKFQLHSSICCSRVKKHFFVSLYSTQAPTDTCAASTKQQTSYIYWKERQQTALRKILDSCKAHVFTSEMDRPTTESDTHQTNVDWDFFTVSSNYIGICFVKQVTLYH